MVGIEAIDCAGTDLGVVAQREETRIEVTGGADTGNLGRFELFSESQAATGPCLRGDAVGVWSAADFGAVETNRPRTKPPVTCTFV